MVKRLLVFLLLLTFSAAMFAQTSGTLRGQVTDESGALIPGAKVAVSGPGGLVKVVTAGNDGSYAVAGLASGKYTVRASSSGLVPLQPASVDVGNGSVSLNLQLLVALDNE